MILICILKENGSIVIQEFSTLTVDIESMRDLMKEHCVEEAGIESTGVYWIENEFQLLCTKTIFPGYRKDGFFMSVCITK